MTTNNHDTDPSAGGAIHVADTEPGPGARKAHVPTDPGLGGPPSSPATPQPHGPLPPPAAAPGSAPRARASKPHDSVDVLLEGMTGPQPDRTNTTPQTDGQASASYHAEHSLKPAHTDPGEEPSVVVEHRRLPPTIRIDRSKIPMDPIPGSTMGRPATPADMEPWAPRPQQEPTYVLPKPVGPRVLLAVGAGIVVVLALYLVVRVASRTPTPTATVGRASAPSVVVPPAAVLPPPSPQPLATVDVSSLPVASATASQSAPSAASSGRIRPRGPATAPSGDIGEFRPTFH
jgi:hypothetical protein